VFFAIEGCPKSDAMLSDGAAVFNVPSVGQWNCEELPDFVEEYLTDKTVIIVNDHDWETKPEVITQARMCQIVLERLGVPVTHVAAPPATYNGLETKGYDDLQGAGGHLEDLLVIDSDPSPILHDWIMERASRRDQARRDEDVLRALSSYCGSMGVFPLQLTTLALIMATYVNRVCRGVQSLERLGAAVVDVKGDLATRRNYPFSRQIEWDERPTITLIPELRSTDGPKQRLGDLIQLPLRAQGAIAYVS
jgi:hypothetical protein